MPADLHYPTLPAWFVVVQPNGASRLPNPHYLPLYLLGEYLSWPLPESSLSLGATVGERLNGGGGLEDNPLPVPSHSCPPEA